MSDVDALREKYPEGTRLRLCRDISDPFSPKRQDDIMTVSFVDDAGQIHGIWESGGSIALIVGLDVFEVADHSTGT